MPDRRYTVVPRTLCFILQGDDVLLLRGAPNKRLWANRLNGVGGHVEAGESIQAAALREIHEETGLTVRHLRLRGILTPSVEGTLAWYPRRIFMDDSLSEHLPELMDDLRLLLPRVLAADDPFCS